MTGKDYPAIVATCRVVAPVGCLNDTETRHAALARRESVALRAVSAFKNLAARAKLPGGARPRRTPVKPHCSVNRRRRVDVGVAGTWYRPIGRAYERIGCRLQVKTHIATRVGFMTTIPRCVVRPGPVGTVRRDVSAGGKPA